MLDRALSHFQRDALDAAEQLHVLTHSQEVKQRVVLRAVAYELVGLQLLGGKVEALEIGLSASGLLVARENLEHGCFACAIYSQQTEHFSLLQA